MSIREATQADLPLITSLVRELAEYEKLAHQAVATEADFAESLFGPSPKAYALIVEHDGQPAGFAIYFYNYSTFLGRPGIYVEDVFVRPEFRRTASAEPCSNIWRKRRWPRNAAGWSGGCWTGTSRRSTSIAAWAPRRWTNGRCSA